MWGLGVERWVRMDVIGVGEVLGLRIFRLFNSKPDRGVPVRAFPALLQEVVSC